MRTRPARLGSLLGPGGGGGGGASNAMAAMMAAAAAAGGAGSSCSPAPGEEEVALSQEEVASAAQRLFTGEAVAGKGNVDLKWRAILASGDRVGPFTGAAVLNWVTRGDVPPGLSRGKAGPPLEASLAGIISGEYNAQRLPGLKFYKPLPLVSHGAQGAGATGAATACVLRAPGAGWPGPCQTPGQAQAGAPCRPWCCAASRHAAHMAAAVAHLLTLPRDPPPSCSSFRSSTLAPSMSQ